MRKEVLQRRGLGAPKGGDLVGQAATLVPLVRAAAHPVRLGRGYLPPEALPSGAAAAAAGSPPSASASGTEPTFTRHPILYHASRSATHFALSRAWAVRRPPQFGQGSGRAAFTEKVQSG